MTKLIQRLLGPLLVVTAIGFVWASRDVLFSGARVEAESDRDHRKENSELTVLELGSQARSNLNLTS
ncbi:MAG: MchE protein, partial [Planctomycetota bacterium]